MEDYNKVKGFARTLLATTCLTIGASAAHAGAIFTESTDFSNSINTPTSLGGNFTTVTGTVNGVDFEDAFLNSGFTPGDTLLVTVGTEGTINGVGSFYLNDDSGNQLAAFTVDGSVSIVVPSNGNVVAAINNSESSGNYSVSFADLGPTGAPEPATLGLTGVALASALALRRKKV